MTAANNDLAVVISAFKPDFLGRALESLSKQTDQRFTIYICDDASPADIKSIVQSALGERPYVYQRFDDNLGRYSIARQWDRCVCLVRERWLWIFSDDDIMDSDCVRSFHSFIQTEGADDDVLRFDGWIINERDEVIEPFPVNYDKESWLEFAYGCLMNWRRAFLQQLIFRAETLRRVGFLDLPMGWATDYAAIIATAREKPVRRIPNASVYWRQSDKNMAPDVSFKARESKLRAVCLFLQWLQGQLDTPREHLFQNDDVAFRQAMDNCLVRAVMTQGAIAALANWQLLLDTRAKVCRASRVALMQYVAVAALKDAMSGFGSASKALVKKFAI